MLSVFLEPQKIGIFSDTHNRIDSLKKILEKHSDIKTWVCLGDLFCFFDIENNQRTFDYLKHDLSKRDIFFLMGNHDKAVSDHILGIDFESASFIKQKFQSVLEIEIEEKTYCFSHSKHGCNSCFIEGLYTEREFVDDFVYCENDCEAAIIGHHHRSFNFHFPNIKTQIWAVASVKDQEEYAILENGSIARYKL